MTTTKPCPVSVKARGSIEGGFVLLEALVAILIFSMGVLALVGLQGAMVKGTTESKNRSDASFIAERRIGMMWTDPNNLANYAGTTTIAELPNGSMVTTVVVLTGETTVTITWQSPGEPVHRYAINARIAGAI